MSIVFACTSCGHSTAMLTNKAETQMVRSLGVAIGGRTKEAAPMEMLRSRLQGRRETPIAESARMGSKCPFTGVVAQAFAGGGQGMQWSEGATARLNRIPAFVRPSVQRSVEDYARRNGLTEINTSVMDAVKGNLGM